MTGRQRATRLSLDRRLVFSKVEAGSLLVFPLFTPTIGMVVWRGMLVECSDAGA